MTRGFRFRRAKSIENASGRLPTGRYTKLPPVFHHSAAIQKAFWRIRRRRSAINGSKRPARRPPTLRHLPSWPSAALRPLLCRRHPAEATDTAIWASITIITNRRPWPPDRATARNCFFRNRIAYCWTFTASRSSPAVKVWARAAVSNSRTLTWPSWCPLLRQRRWKPPSSPASAHYANVSTNQTTTQQQQQQQPRLPSPRRRPVWITLATSPAGDGPVQQQQQQQTSNNNPQKSSHLVAVGANWPVYPLCRAPPLLANLTGPNKKQKTKKKNIFSCTFVCTRKSVQRESVRENRKKKDMLGRKLMDYLKVFQCGWSSGHFVLLFFFLSLFQKFLKWPFWLLLPVRACTTVSGAKKEKSFACRRRQWTWTDTPIYFYYYIYLRAFYFTFGIIFSPFFPFPPLFPGLWPGCEKEREEKKSKERHFEGIRRESSDCDRVCVWNWKRKIIILGGKLCVAFIILEEGQNNKKNCVFGWGDKQQEEESQRFKIIKSSSGPAVIAWSSVSAFVCVQCQLWFVERICSFTPPFFWWFPVRKKNLFWCGETKRFRFYKNLHKN